MSSRTIVEDAFHDQRKPISVGLLEVEFMVKVITIMDDVYADLWKLKASKGMSFSEVFRYLLKNKQDEDRNIIKLAGSISSEDIDHRAMYRIKEEHTWMRR